VVNHHQCFGLSLQRDQGKFNTESHFHFKHMPFLETSLVLYASVRGSESVFREKQSNMEVTEGIRVPKSQSKVTNLKE